MIWIAAMFLGFVCCKFFYEGGRTMMRREMMAELKNYTFVKKINMRV